MEYQVHLLCWSRPHVISPTHPWPRPPWRAQCRCFHWSAPPASSAAGGRGDGGEGGMGTIGTHAEDVCSHRHSAHTLPGVIFPARSASSIIARPMRSLTLDAGSWLSSLASTVACTPSVTLCSLSRGVLPAGVGGWVGGGEGRGNWDLLALCRGSRRRRCRHTDKLRDVVGHRCRHRVGLRRGLRLLPVRENEGHATTVGTNSTVRA